MPAITSIASGTHESWRSPNESSSFTPEAQLTPLTVRRETSLSEVIALMSHDRQTCQLACNIASEAPTGHLFYNDSLEQPSLDLSCAVIVENNTPIGIFTGRDLVRLAAQGTVISKQTVESVMTYPLITINQKNANDVFAAVSLLRQHHIRHLPVIDDDGKLVGILTRERIRQSLKLGAVLHLHHATDTMTHDVIQAAPTATLKEIAQLMTQYQISCVVITEIIENKTFPLGIVTEGDIVQFQTLRLDVSALTAESVMSSPVFCAPPTFNLWQAHQRMVKHRITHLVIIHEDGSLAGLLTQTTLLNTLHPAAMVEVISLLQERIKHLETEKLQLLESRNAELSEAVKLKTADLEQQNEFERLLTHINNHVRSSLDFNTVITTATTVLQDALKVDRALVYRFNPDWSGKVLVEAIAGKQWSLLNREFCDTLAAVPYQSTTVKAIANIGDSGLEECYVKFLEAIDVKSILVAAIAQEGKLWGLLMLHNCHALRHWQEREVNLIRNVSSQLAIALRQASTHEALQQELTTRQQTELLLRESEQRYVSLTEVIPVVLFRASISGSCIYVNERWTELTGMSQQNALGQGWLQAVYSDDQQQVMTAWQQAVQAGQPFQHEYRLQLFDGSTRWVYAQAHPEWSVTNKICGYAGSLTDISDRKHTEFQLEKTSQRLQQAQRIAQLGNWELNLQTNNLYWSDEVFRIFEIGQSQFSASYDAFLDAIHPDDREMVNQAYTQHVEDGLPYSIVHRLLMSDGRIKHVQEHCETIWDGNGNALFSRGTVLDITTLKEAEQKRQQAETSLRQIVEGTATVTDCDFFQELVQHIAKALDVRYASISEATSDGFSILAFCADGHLQPVDDCSYEQVPCCQQALQNGLCYHPKASLTLYPDNEFFKNLNAESYLGIGLRNSSGEPIGHLCIMHDSPLSNPEGMTNLLKIFGARAGAELERYQTARQLQDLTNKLEQRVAERTTDLANTVDHLQAEIIKRQILTDQLQDSQAQLHDLFDSANDMIQSVSLKDGSFEFVNRAWLETLGYTLQDLEQLTIFDVLHPDCQEHCKSLMEYLHTGQMQSLDQVELSFVAKDSRVIAAEGNVNCRIVNGRPVYTRGIFRDISDRKKAEAEIIKALEQERELNEMKSRFVSNTSHEFRTPLTVISSNAELLQLFGDKLEETEKQKCLETILDYVEHTTELINDVLIVSKAESGKITLNLNPIDIVEFSQQLMQTIGLSAPNHHFEFVVQDTRPQPQPYGYTAQLDRKILQQSLTNLLTNAIKYSPKGSTITFQLALLTHAIEFRVMDEGLGIPEDDQKYLFAPFHRATNVGTIQGTGLGLSIVKHLVTVHQGSIQVTSTPGEGSCFTVKIPTHWQEVEP